MPSMTSLFILPSGTRSLAESFWFDFLKKYQALSFLNGEKAIINKLFAFMSPDNQTEVSCLKELLTACRTAEGEELCSNFVQDFVCRREPFSSAMLTPSTRVPTRA